MYFIALSLIYANREAGECQKVKSITYPCRLLRHKRQTIILKSTLYVAKCCGILNAVVKYGLSTGVGSSSVPEPPESMSSRRDNNQFHIPGERKTLSYEDKTMACRDCGQQFTFTAGEQEFYNQKGFTNSPSRCPDCRSQRKSSGERRGGGGDREMFSATCSACGGEAKVPFQPSGDKPVYCSDCFRSQRNTGGGGGGGRW